MAQTQTRGQAQLERSLTPNIKMRIMSVAGAPVAVVERQWRVPNSERVVRRLAAVTCADIPELMQGRLLRWLGKRLQQQIGAILATYCYGK